MGHHHGKHHAAEQEEHEVEETTTTLYRAVGGGVDGPLNGETALVDPVDVNVVALHACIGYINRYLAAELVNLKSSAVVRGDAG